MMRIRTTSLGVLIAFSALSAAAQQAGGVFSPTRSTGAQQPQAGAPAAGAVPVSGTGSVPLGMAQPQAGGQGGVPLPPPPVVGATPGGNGGSPEQQPAETAVREAEYVGKLGAHQLIYRAKDGGVFVVSRHKEPRPVVTTKETGTVAKNFKPVDGPVTGAGATQAGAQPAGAAGTAAAAATTTQTMTAGQALQAATGATVNPVRK